MDLAGKKTYKSFDDSRIKHHPDKYLLAKIREYFDIFTGGQFDAMKDLESDEYTMTDIPLGKVHTSRSDWYEINKTFVSLMTDLRVVAISLYGSANAGDFSVLEHVVWFKLKADPPPQAADNLPTGAKGGDTVGMINVSVLWWTEDGQISKELEYGRLTWKGFDVDEFDAERKVQQQRKLRKGAIARAKL